MGTQPVLKYQYDPSSGMAITFAILFSLATLLHLYQMIRTRTWYMTAFVAGGIFELAGYYFRYYNTLEEPGSYSKIPFIAQTLLILVAPALFAASIYMQLRRIILVTNGERMSIIRTSLLTKFFVFGDVISFLVQALGGVILSTANSKSSHDRGQTVIIIGLVLQILFFGLFMVVSVIFQLRIRRNPTVEAARFSHMWKLHIYSLYATSILILIRSIFRLIEYLQGMDGYLLSHEWPLYVFDGLLMLGVMLVLNFIHGSEIVATLRGGRYTKRGGFKMIDNYSHSNISTVDLTA